MTRTDQELLRMFAADGDPTAMTELADRHGSWIVAAAHRRVGDAHAAEDVRQAVFLLLLEKTPDLAARDGPPLAAWLFQATHFCCARLRRGRSRRERHEGAAGAERRADCRPAVPDAAVVAAVEETIAHLPADDREAIVRRFYQGETYAQVGRSLGVSEEAARKRVARAVETCRQAFTADGGPPEMPLGLEPHRPTAGPGRPPPGNRRVRPLAKGALSMIEQAFPLRFPVVSTELTVASVEANLAFFEHLGFRRWYTQEVDAGGRVPRASLRGGAGRIWLRRADAGTVPVPTAGVTVYFWVDGGEPAVVAHRNAIAARGVAANPFYYDGALLNFTVTTPDGYRVGFFSTYAPHTFDPVSDG